RVAAPSDRARAPAIAAVRRDHPGEYRIRQTRSECGRDHGGGQGRQRARVHPPAGGRVRHGHRRAGRDPVGRAAAAHRHRARAHPQRPDPDSGRAHDRPRRGKRGDGAPGVGPPDGRQDLSHDHARPPFDHGCRLGAPAGRRPHHRPRHAQRADGAERPLPAPVRAQSRAAGGRLAPMSQAMRVTSQLPRVRPGGFPADPDFPQLAIASDPQRMLELFRRHLEPEAGKRYRIETCVPLRFRCRQSTARCVLQYTLRLLDPETGRGREQGATGLLYAQKGTAERLWREMQATDPSQGIPDEWLTFRPVGFIPELDMVVQLFPYDRKLRNLRGVLGGALHDLDPQLLARLAPGEWRVTERTMEPTRYRTELGAALKYTLQARDAATGRDATLRCFVKVYRNDHGEHTFELLQSLGQRGETRYAVVRPVAYRADLRTLVLEEAPGTALQTLLRGGRDAAHALRITARA